MTLEDASDGTEDGMLIFKTMVDGTARSRIAMTTSNGTVFNEDGQALDFRVENGTLSHAFYVSGSNSANMIGINQASPAAMLDIVTVNTAGADAIRLRQPASSETYQIQMGVSGVTNNGLYIRSTASTGQLQKWESGQVVINDDGVDRDFRVESNGNANMLFVDGGNNRVGVGTSNPLAVLDIHGSTNAYSTMSKIYLTDVSGHADSKNWSIGNGGSAYGAFTIGVSNAAGGDPQASGTHFNPMIISKEGNVVFNEDSKDADFRVESNNNANMFVVDASNDTIGIGTQPNNNNLSPAMHFVNGGTMFGYGDAMYITGNTYYNSSWKAIATGGGANTVIDSAGFKVYNNASASANATVSPLLHLTVGPSEMVINDDSYDYDFRVESDGNANMLFVDGGNDRVGIGTNAPAEILHAYHGSSTAAIRVSGEGNVNRKCQIEYNATDGPIIRSGSSGITSLKFAVDNSTLAGKFDTNADFYTNDGTVHSLSDIRVKKDVEDLSDGLDIVKQLKPRTFRYTADSEFYNEDTKGEIRYGFVANEVEEVAPQYTDTGKGKIGGEEVEDLKSLSTTKMIPMLVKAIQEQSAIIDDLRARVSELETN